MKRREFIALAGGAAACSVVFEKPRREVTL
jgi:hypothetical protein